MASRRNFTRNQQEAIVLRATDARGVIRCEGCSGALKRGEYEIDHIIPEALRPEADKQRPLTIAEGQLLGRDCCHRGPEGKTNHDVKQIAKAKRQNAGHLGIRVAKSRPIPKPIKTVSPRTARNRDDPKHMPPRRNIFTGEAI